MLGTGLQFARGEDRFYNSAKARSRAHQNHRAEHLRRAHSDVSPSQSPSSSSSEPESRPTPPKRIAVPPASVVSSPLSNLERFLQSITPSVPAQYPSKVCFFCSRLFRLQIFFIFPLFSLQFVHLLWSLDDEEGMEAFRWGDFSAVFCARRSVGVFQRMERLWCRSASDIERRRFCGSVLCSLSLWYSNIRRLFQVSGKTKVIPCFWHLGFLFSSLIYVNSLDMCIFVIVLAN